VVVLDEDLEDARLASVLPEGDAMEADAEQPEGDSPAEGEGELADGGGLGIGQSMAPPNTSATGAVISEGPIVDSMMQMQRNVDEEEEEEEEEEMVLPGPAPGGPMDELGFPILDPSQSGMSPSAQLDGLNGEDDGAGLDAQLLDDTPDFGADPADLLEGDGVLNSDTVDFSMGTS
jgi:hypothetical protein